MSQPYSAANTPFVPDPSTYAPKVKVPMLKRGRSSFSGTADNTPPIAHLATLTTGVPLQSVEAQSSLFMAGACPVVYDGGRVHEAGYNFYPETSYLSGGVGAVFSFVLVYEWQDSNGKLWRSGPSVPVQGLLAATTLKIAPMLLTDKQGPQGASTNGTRDAIKIVGYRTTNAGTVYYREGYINNRVSDGTSTLSDTYTFGALADNVLITGEILYTAGGALEDEVFSASSICCTHQRRIFTVRQENQSFVQYTNEADDQFIAVGTSEIYRIPVPPEGGSVVGLASMDSNLVIFCQHRIYFIAGDGPNRLGAQNGYSLPQLCSGKLGMLGGCADSIALTPEGLWFMSSAGGLRLLNRGLQISMEGGENGSNAYLGRESDGLIPTSFTRVRSASIDAKSQIRWYFSGSIIVAYDYQQQVWSRFTNHDSSGGVTSARGLFWHSDGNSLYSTGESAGGQDVTTDTTQVAETAWIALGDVQGFQRIYKLMLLGQAMSTCAVDLAVGYDYDETWITGAGGSTGTLDFQGIAISLINLTGPFQVGDEVTGVTSGAHGFITHVGDLAGADLIYVTPVDSGDFVAGETIGNQLAETAEIETVVSPYPRVLIVSGLTTAPLLNQRVVGLTSGVTAVIAGVALISAGTYRIQLSVPAVTFTAAETVRIETPFTYTAVASNPLQLEHPMSKQQCEAVRFRVTITPSSASEALRLTNFGLSVGLKKGTFKLASSKRF